MDAEKWTTGEDAFGNWIKYSGNGEEIVCHDVQHLRLRDKAVDATIDNLVMAGVLLPPEVARYMAHLGGLTDDELARQLVGSRFILDGHYAQVVEVGRN